MATNLPYFQFDPGQYMSGSIQFCSLKAQGLFINILSIYWQRECELTIVQLRKRWDEPELIQELIDEKVIKVVDDKIHIKFLDSHYNNVVELSKTRSENGKIGNKKRWGEDRKPIANPSQNVSNTIAFRVDKIREDKRREDNTTTIIDVVKKARRSKKPFVPPTVDEVKAYFLHKGYTEQGAIAAFEYYSTADWYDSKGDPVLNWKQKCIANWFKPQYKSMEPKKATLVH